VAFLILKIKAKKEGNPKSKEKGETLKVQSTTIKEKDDEDRYYFFKGSIQRELEKETK
jgi:hypothetical protein